MYLEQLFVDPMHVFGISGRDNVTPALGFPLSCCNLAAEDISSSISPVKSNHQLLFFCSEDSCFDICCFEICFDIFESSSTLVMARCLSTSSPSIRSNFKRFGRLSWINPAGSNQNVGFASLFSPFQSLQTYQGGTLKWQLMCSKFLSGV
jgi:hypothetical protein